jgi:hypothetical protein
MSLHISTVASFVPSRTFVYSFGEHTELADAARVLYIKGALLGVSCFN